MKNKRYTGNWGIYKSDDILPQTRWDPFRTIIIEDKGKIGFRSLISPQRQNRPIELTTIIRDVEQIEKGEDTFCKIISGRSPAILVSKDTIFHGIYSKKLESRNYSKNKMITIINHFSPLIRNKVHEDYFIKNQESFGLALIHLFTNHYTKFENITVNELIAYLMNLKLTILNLKEILKDNGNNIQIMHFFNVGARAGASISHLHGQTYIYTSLEGKGWKKRGYERINEISNAKTDKNQCFACELITGIKKDNLGQTLNFKKRIVLENRDWTVFTSFAPERDGHLRIIPRNHKSSIWELDKNEIKSLAFILKKVNYLLSQFIKEYSIPFSLSEDRNIIFRQPFKNNKDSHLLIEILPSQGIGGVELFDDCKIINQFPEIVSEYLRKVEK